MWIMDVINATIGGVTSGIAGIGAISESKKYNKLADERINELDKLSTEQFMYFKESLNALEGIFGSIQKNLSEYYSSLSPTSFAAQEIKNIETDFSRIQTRVNEDLAKRGISDSGISEALNSQINQNLAVKRAEARFEAPQQVANLQGSFANALQPRLNALTQGLQNSYNQRIGLNASLADMYSKKAQSSSTLAGNAFGNIGNSLSSISQAYTYNNFLKNVEDKFTNNIPNVGLNGVTSPSAMVFYKPEAGGTKTLSNFNWLDQYIG